MSRQGYGSPAPWEQDHGSLRCEFALSHVFLPLLPRRWRGNASKFMFCLYFFIFLFFFFLTFLGTCFGGCILEGCEISRAVGVVGTRVEVKLEGLGGMRWWI